MGSLGDLGDVDPHVGDSLEVEVDVEQRGQEAQVRGNGTLRGEDHHDPALDLHVEGVNLVVAGDHGVGIRLVAGRHDVERPAEEVMGGHPHAQDDGLEFVELFLEVPARLDHYPNLPVM